MSEPAPFRGIEHSRAMPPDTPILLWPAFTGRKPPPPGSVLVLGAILRCDPSRERRIHRWLSDEEHRRAARFRAEAYRHRFVVSRGVLREALAFFTGARPESLEFVPSPQGKPCLPAFPEFQFNLAHSGSLMLLALSTAGEVGVDVERFRPLQDAQAIARRYFTPREAGWLEAQAHEDRDAAFFKLWVRKEAVLKAAGHGIAFGLNQVEVIDPDGGFPETVTQGPSPRTHWRLHGASPADGFDGVVATPMRVRHLERRAWAV